MMAISHSLSSKPSSGQLFCYLRLWLVHLRLQINHWKNLLCFWKKISLSSHLKILKSNEAELCLLLLFVSYQVTKKFHHLYHKPLSRNLCPGQKDKHLFWNFHRVQYLRDYSLSSICTFRPKNFFCNLQLSWGFGLRFCRLFFQWRSYRSSRDGQSRNSFYRPFPIHQANSSYWDLNGKLYSCTSVESVLQKTNIEL